MSVEEKALLSLEAYRHEARYGLPRQLSHRLGKLSYQLGLADAKALSLPNFLCVGFRKTGTTWLYENLHYHPELYLPPFKNVRYFSQYFDRPLSHYAAQFSPGITKVKGDFSNSYSTLSVRRIRFIRTVMPEVKLIFLLRNPVERAWSEFVHRTVSAERPLSSYSEADILAALQKGTVEAAGGYSAVLETWEAVFPMEQVFIGFYDDIAQRPQTLLGDLFAFLGVSQAVDWTAFPYDACIIPPAGEQYEHCNGWRGVIATKHQNTAELLDEGYETYKVFLLTLLEPELIRLEQHFGPRVKVWFD